jgi:exopolyphosphatase/guanosine-5'-triphosphate,3'-diphosphate pyrophosphatase
MTETIAIIDLGTNTFNMLIVEHNFHSFKLLHQQKIAVKLGEGGMNENIIRPPSYQRAIDGIGEHCLVAKKLHCKHVYAFATSAMRSSENGQQLANEIAEKHQVHIQIIDGDKEAELIYLGVKQAFKKIANVSLIMDIGGGSTEFILCDNKKVLWKKSYDLGAARLLEWLIPADPITAFEQNKLFARFDDELMDLFDALNVHQPKTLIGSSGSFDSLHEMIMHQKGTPDLAYQKNHVKLPKAAYIPLAKKIIASTTEQRLNMPGLVSMRVDMIVIATLFIEYIRLKTNIKNIYQCQYALKEGVLFEKMFGEKK